MYVDVYINKLIKLFIFIKDLFYNSFLVSIYLKLSTSVFIN
jgi:hypothetical protein